MKRRETIMFRDTKAFSSFSVDDLKKARQFYGEVLGLEVSEGHEGLRLNAGDGPLKTDSKGISTSPDGPKIAWFKDPAGNFLAVLEEGM
jgi:predicted enzyme related to lactoylglutathione lyase